VQFNAVTANRSKVFHGMMDAAEPEPVPITRETIQATRVTKAAMVKIIDKAMERR